MKFLKNYYFIIIILPIVIYFPELIGLTSSDPMMTSSTVIVNPPPFTHGGLLPGNPGWIDGCAGVFVEALGRLVTLDWLHGIIPWWNPYSGVGMPFAGEYQPAAFFLPFVLFLALPNGLLMMKCTLQIIAGLSTYAFLKKIPLAPKAAFIGALLYMFNGTYAWASDGPSEPLAFLPLALYGVECAREGRWGWLTIGLSYLMLSGFPETAYLLGLLVLGWAVVRFFQSGKDRLKYTTNIILAGLVAALIAAPQLLAFMSYLPYADVGSHASVNDTPLPTEAWSMLFFPYINGPFFYGNQFNSWYALGGYLGVINPLIALISLSIRKYTSLRWFLFLFAISIIGKQANLPIITWVIDHIPEAAHTVFYRLSEPVVEACFIFLVSFAIDDLIQKRLSPRKYIYLCFSLVSVILGWVIFLDLPMIKKLHSFSYGPITSHQYFIASVIMTSFEMLLLLFLYLKKSSPQKIGIFAFLCNLIFFAFPLLSARPEHPLDQPFLDSLRTETKNFQRFVTLGPIEPNYGVYLGIPSINFNAIPTPRNWIARIKKDFGNRLDPVTFDGDFPRDENGSPFLQKAVLFQPHLFEDLAVSALVTAHNSLGLSPYPLKGRELKGYALTPDKPTLRVNIKTWNNFSAQKIMLKLGTYFHQSDGTLTLAFCSHEQCASGKIDLKLATDNEFTPVVLDRSIPDAATSLTFSLIHAHSPVMIWGSSQGDEIWPILHVEPLEVSKELIFVKSGAIGDLYRFRHPAPYFEADPSCLLTPISREEITTSCTQPSHLIRRELMMPGWSATINNRNVSINSKDDLFEEINIPQGKSHIKFYFKPKYANWSFISFFLGLLVLFFHFARNYLRKKRSIL
ncbi:YfhO family protein [Swingsia samuiensis]|uniref:YfhO family protein n=1 Tax=Swingsia samuiensis TaxID=1293412 RepID=A0A4Y6UJD9_9PROT|nr:YfhO family protein [Swingsia samuiensis]QDH16586.1 hypothetical protein E3D00_02615 [Swingsia samuiensis]